MRTTGDEKKKYKVLTINGCPFCEELKETINNFGISNQFEIIDESNPEYEKLTSELGIDKFPTILDKDNKKCFIEFTEENADIICGEPDVIEYQTDIEDISTITGDKTEE